MPGLVPHNWNYKKYLSLYLLCIKVIQEFWLLFIKGSNYINIPLSTYILLDILLCSIAEYFYKLGHKQTNNESKFSTIQYYTTKCLIRETRQIGIWNFVDIYLQGMRDRSMWSGTELAHEIKLTDWSMAGNLSNQSSGVQIPSDICTRLKRYLYSAKCSWIITSITYVVNMNMVHKILKSVILKKKTVTSLTTLVSVFHKAST